MGFAVVMALCLCGQEVYSTDDTLDQWESGLLESKWALTDRDTGAPQMLLVLKCLPPEHRIFELTMYNNATGPATPNIDVSPYKPAAKEDVPTIGPVPRLEAWPKIEAWTGTYKMESRKASHNSMDNQENIKLVRLQVEQHWMPVDRQRLWWARIGGENPTQETSLEPTCLKDVLRGRGLIDWTDEISYIHWFDRKDFKPFYVELIFEAPFLREQGPLTSDHIKFFLRSDSVRKIGWWKIGTQYTLDAVKKMYF